MVKQDDGKDARQGEFEQERGDGGQRDAQIELRPIQLIDFWGYGVGGQNGGLAQARNSGGETGIRTLDRVSPIHAFQACAFNHSAISPEGVGELESE